MLPQVVVDYLLAGDVNAASLIARLPAALLCRHTAAVGAELLAFRARLRDAQAGPAAAGAVAAPAWAELPEEFDATGAAAGDTPRCSSPEPGEDDRDVADLGLSGSDYAAGGKFTLPGLLVEEGSGQVESDALFGASGAPRTPSPLDEPHGAATVGSASGRFPSAGEDGDMWLAIEVSAPQPTLCSFKFVARPSPRCAET